MLPINQEPNARQEQLLLRRTLLKNIPVYGFKYACLSVFALESVKLCFALPVTLSSASKKDTQVFIAISAALTGFAVSELAEERVQYYLKSLRQVLGSQKLTQLLNAVDPSHHQHWHEHLRKGSKEGRFLQAILQLWYLGASSDVAYAVPMLLEHYPVTLVWKNINLLPPGFPKSSSWFLPSA